MTLERASREFNVSKETLRRGFQQCGFETGKGKRYTVADVWKALSGDLKAARAREALANAIAKERDNRIADGETMTLAENLAWQERVHLPIRQRLIALPGSMAQRCNPSDPKFAESALSQWLKETLPILRTEIANQGRKV